MRWKIMLPLWAAMVGLVSSQAYAEYRVRSPSEIDLGAIELEHNGSAAFDRAPANDGATSYTSEFGTGVTPRWHTELELDYGRDAGPDQTTRYQGGASENSFLLTEPGEYWATLGFYGEYAWSSLHGVSDSIKFGPLVQKDIGHTTHTLNLFLEKGIGSNQGQHGVDFNYAWQSRWNVWRPLSPAIEIYGDMGPVDHPSKFNDQQFLVGPVGVGSLMLGRSGLFKYELGWLFGATPATANGTLRWRLELEIPF